MRMAATLVVLLAALFWALNLAQADSPSEPEELAAAASIQPSELWLSLGLDSLPLRLELESSRELCTAGTLTEISWTIHGGAPPYSLSVDGSAVDVSAENVRINCGALTGAEAADEKTALAARTVTATVMDSRGVRREVTIESARARALPAPTGVHLDSYPGEISVVWDNVATDPSSTTNTDTDIVYAIRYRPVASLKWRYTDPREAPVEWIAIDSGPHLVQMAAMRARIEQETPSVLVWTEGTQIATPTDPQKLTVAATHDSITVSWDRQPLAQGSHGYVELQQADQRSGALARRFIETNAGGRHTVTFAQLSPNVEYEATIFYTSPDRDFTAATVNTTTASVPTGWAPPPAGPQNLSAKATHNSITVRWDAPHPDAEARYLIQIFDDDDDTQIDTKWLHDGTTQWVSYGSFRPVQPSTTYRVLVTHLAIPAIDAEISITTRPAPTPSGTAAAQSTAPPFEWWADGRPNIPALYLKLEGSRELCTAGTLTEISWDISGGVAPYSLSVDGSAVDVGAEGVRINCGALTETEATDEDAALAAKTITAVVTDSRGVRREAAIDVARARALPAPTDFSHWSYPRFAVVAWGSVPGVGTFNVPGEAPDGRAIQYQLDAYLVRYRPNAAAPWAYAMDKRQYEESPWARVGDGLHILSVAALRDHIEQFTPDALTWSAPYYYGGIRAPENVVATATHNTVTVSWDRQPRTNPGMVTLVTSEPGGLVSRPFDPTEEAGRGTVIFRNLPPDTAFEAIVRLDTNGWPGPNATTVRVRTKPAPADFELLERAPQNLRATATHDSITVTWTLPYPDPHAQIRVSVFDAASGHRVVSHWLYNGETSTTLRSGIFLIWPSTRYRVVVRHISSIPVGQSEVYVTTLPAPAPSGADGVQSTVPPAPPFEWWANGRPNVPALYLKLESSRELCTAGTLTEISWDINRGTSPYSLTVDEMDVEPDAESVRINCGTLTEAETADEEAELSDRWITATATDSRGVRHQAVLSLARAHALPAPQNVEYLSYVADVLVFWDEVDGAGSQSPRSVHPVTGNELQVSGAVRTRANQDGAFWAYHKVEKRGHSSLLVEPTSGLRVLSVAAVRHPLELETPEALNWCPELVYASTKEAQNVVISATHDTVTVSWDKQPYASRQGLRVTLIADEAGGDRAAILWEQGVSGRHQVTFTHLPPATDFTLEIIMVDTTATSGPPPYAVRTKPAPAGWTPPPRGVQNIQVLTSNTGHTFTWEAPFTVPASQPTNWFLA